MNKIVLIIKREYLTRVKKKSFLLMTVLGPLLFVGVVIGAMFLGSTDSKVHYVLVIDETPELNETREFSKRATANIIGGVFESSDQVHYKFSWEDMENEDFKESEYTLLLYLNEKILANRKAQLYFKKYPSASVINKINRDINKAVEKIRLKSTSISMDDYNSIKAGVNLLPVDIENESEKSYQQERATIGLVFAVLIYMFVFMYGVMVMRGVIEEKTNRIIEVLISSVKPFQLMMGKIVGIAMVGLTQFLLWVILSGVLYSVALPMIMNDTDVTTVMTTQDALLQSQTAEMGEVGDILEVLTRINWLTMISLFIFYFLGGYLLYSALFAAVGSAVDNETDTQQFVLPVTIPLIFALYVSIGIATQNPDSAATTFLSIFPLTSPIVMMVRAAMGFGEGTIWQLYLSMFLLIATFILTTWFAAKIYRVGILMYGKKTSYKELWKWLKYKA